MEKETLIQFGSRSSGRGFDIFTVNKLFMFGLIEIDIGRRVILTAAGQAIYDELVGKIGTETKTKTDWETMPLTTKWRECSK
jgi:hypothetical protein